MRGSAAVKVLRRELKVFRNHGLENLHADLRKRGVVLRCDWLLCPLSYSFGNQGSCEWDSQGKPRNAFTDAWDTHRITKDRVALSIESELRRRRGVRQRERLCASQVSSQ